LLVATQFLTIETAQMRQHTVWINGRFITRNITGVERVAHELLRALDENYLDENGSCIHSGVRLTFKIAAPRSGNVQLPRHIGQIPVQVVGTLSGHAWEQLSLSSWAPCDWLLNLCNTAPIWRKRQSIFFHDAQVYAIPGNFDWKFRLWYRALLVVAGRRATGLFTNSSFSRSELSRHAGIPEKKIVVLHLGADHMARIHPAIPPELLDHIPNAPFLLAVSSANPNKNFISVVNALRLLGNSAPPCVFVGQKYANVFRDTQIDSSRVTELGYVSDATLAALYSQAFCLAFPSFYEGFGLPPLEAMTFGTPVIVSNTSSLPEVCADAALYCDPSDASTLAGAITALQHNPQLADNLRIAGQKRAASFTWQQCAKTMLDQLCQTIDTVR
jgi:glycosyltransferase involved in cell wall biosynthesis